MASRTDTCTRQLNIMFAAEITARYVALALKRAGRKATKPVPTSASIEVPAKRMKLGVKTEPGARRAYKPPPPRPARGYALHGVQ